MVQRGILTLLTDFGLSDVYVGIMKGVIAQINPHLTPIDLTHQISPQNIAAARFALMSAYSYFPVGTVHIAVVDPGVGGKRRAIALAVGQDSANPIAYCVGPDNGVLSGVVSQVPVLAAVELTNSQYWRTANPSRTFHGRDIFAPVGAHLASGVAIEKLGSPISPQSLVSLPEFGHSGSDKPGLEHSGLNQSEEILPDGRCKVRGAVQAIDHFGNLITTVPSERVGQLSWSVELAGQMLPRRSTYSEVAAGQLVALIGSHGWIEIAVNGGSARTQLELDVGAPIDVWIQPVS